MIECISINKLNIIPVTGGNVMHALKANEDSFVGFGEAYFSNIEYKSIKAWKRHKTMTTNIIVPIGRIKFVFLDDRSNKKNLFQEVTVSKNNYVRITIPPLIWFGFQGLYKKESTLLNIADIPHDPCEVETKNINEFKYNWENI
tara:strand:+ start:315 stop:746 length:432 start_codon:yes stop_codon:yes gene_type:complete